MVKNLLPKEMDALVASASDAFAKHQGTLMLGNDSAELYRAFADELADRVQARLVVLCEAEAQQEADASAKQEAIAAAAKK